MRTVYLTPKEIGEHVVEVSRTKARMSVRNMVLLGILGGAYIAFGAQLCTMVTHDLAGSVGLGLSKFIGGSVFSIGLMLVVLCGAELLTGNCLMIMGVMSKVIKPNSMFRNWFFVLIANFLGSMLLVGLVYYSGVWKTGDMGVGAMALKAASLKVDMSFTEAFVRGIGCNWLVCLAFWIAIAERDVASRMLGLYFPVMAFVTSGFEHSIANMYFIPMGIFMAHQPGVAAKLGGDIVIPTWQNFLVGNLLPVTLGNIVGGVIFVGMIYYLVYLHTDRNLPDNVDDRLIEPSTPVGINGRIQQ